MLSRFSVKKPYTVLVSVVLVIILGCVSFTKMTSDLLPSINLPYVIVMTTYPGANPETVEMAVTKPVEQSMATVSNIENESIEGVASVDASGLVEESVHVIIRQDKIDAINEQVFGYIEGEFADAEKEIADGKKELADGQQEPE